MILKIILEVILGVSIMFGVWDCFHLEEKRKIDCLITTLMLTLIEIVLIIG